MLISSALSLVALLLGGVPAHFHATSVSFVSSSTGYVLGTAPCSHHPCTSLLVTHDGGATWSGLPAPRQKVGGTNGSGLWGVRFADARRGYAFGGGLWETSDAGSHWRSVGAPGPVVFALAPVRDRRVIAVVGSCTANASHCANRLTVYRSQIGSRTWTMIGHTGTNAFGGSVAVHRSQVWVLAGSRLWHSNDAGRRFSSQPDPCHPRRSPFFIPSSITDDGAHAYLLCFGNGATGHTDKRVYQAAGTGGHWTLVGRPPAAGDGGSIAAASDGSIVIATASAGSWLYRSTDGGRHWRTVLSENDGGAGWADLGFVTPDQAIVVHGPAVQDGRGDGRAGQLLRSSDAGERWSALSF